jgi:methanesulfonate monooxygenase small subunit
LDNEQFDKYVDLCGPDYQYSITVYSPELRKEQVWLQHNRSELIGLFKMLPQHVRMPGRFFRQVSVYDFGELSDRNTVEAKSSLVVFYTEPEGVSRLFAVGRYHDRISVKDGIQVLLSRTVSLDTRDLSPGAHVPL